MAKTAVKKAAKKSAPKNAARKKPAAKGSKAPASTGPDESVLKIAQEVFKTRTGRDWEDAHEWEKESTLAAVEFYKKNPNASAEDYHNAWMENAKQRGWKYGTIKAMDTKQHPCLIEFKNLPEEQINLDIDFAQRVKNML